MSVLNCTVKAIKDGVTRKGNPYQRLCVIDGAGGEQWMPCFNGKMLSVGDKIMAEVKEGQYSEQYGQSYIIEDFVKQGGESAPANAVQAPQTAAKSGDVDPNVWKIKDLTSGVMAAFKALAPIMYGKASKEEIVNQSFQVALMVDKKVKAYVNGADIDGMRQSLQDEVAQHAEADLAGSTGAFEPGVPPNEGQVQDLTNQALSDGFDDDIPF